MKKLICFLFLFSYGCCYAQDTAWKRTEIDPNISIAFPGIVNKLDTVFRKNGKAFSFAAYSCETSYASLAVIASTTETEINADNSESYEKALEGITKGALKSMTDKGLSCLVSDTLIGRVKGKKFTCHYTGMDDTPILIDYCFLLNDKMYMVQGAMKDPGQIDDGRAVLNKFIESIRLTSLPLKEQQFGSKAESIGYKLGYGLGILLFIGAIVGVIAYFVRKH